MRTTIVRSPELEEDITAQMTSRGRVRELLAQMGPHARYLVSSGNGIASYRDVENVPAMGEAVVEFGRYPISA